MTVPHKMVGLERMSDYRSVRLQRFHCIQINKNPTYHIVWILVIIGDVQGGHKVRVGLLRDVKGQRSEEDWLLIIAVQDRDSDSGGITCRTITGHKGKVVFSPERMVAKRSER